MRKFFAALLFAASALSSPAPDTPSTVETSDSSANVDLDSISSSAAELTVAIPSSILMVMETAIPASWQDEVITDPAFRSSVASAAAAGTYPAWYNELPSSVKAWASSNFDVQVLGVPSTTQDAASQTASQTASHAQITSTSGAQSVTNAAQTTSSGSSSVASSGSGSTTASASPVKSTGGASAPTSGAVLGIIGAAGFAALAVAL